MSDYGYLYNKFENEIKKYSNTTGSNNILKFKHNEIVESNYLYVIIICFILFIVIYKMYV
jgi:hypothetical protein